MRRKGPAIGASVALLVLALSGSAQERAEPAPAAGQQDRIDIAGVLDSWYKVVETNERGEEKAVGFSHEVITRMPAGSPWLWTYELTGEVDAVVPNPAKPGATLAEIHAVHIRAHLDDTFTPVYMDRQDMKGMAALPTRVFSEDNIRKIEVEYAGGERKPFTVNAEEEIFYSRFLMFIALRQNGALSRPGTRKAILMQPREDGTPPYAEVQMEIKDAVKREVMGKKDVSVTPITYLRPPPSASEDELLTAYIDKYGRIVEEEARKTRRVLVKTEKEALGDRPLILSARRDPFRKEGAFSRSSKLDGPGTKDPKPPTGPDAVPGNLAEAKKNLEELLKAKTEKREAEGEKIYRRQLDLIDALLQSHARQALNPNDLALLEQIRVDTEKIWGGIDRLMKKARLIFVRSTQMFDRDDAAGMEAGVKEIKGLLNSKELVHAPGQLAELHKWIGQLEPLVVRCKTRLDLAKKKLVLTGTTLSEVWEQVPLDVRVSVFGHQVGSVLDVRFVKPIRIAILNGKAYRVGDTVDGEGVRVEKIWPHGVQVSLRDETRDVGIRQ